MTTAAANSTTTGTLPANTLLRVLGDSIVTMTRDGAFVAKQSTARDNFVGPYPTDTTYSVVAGGAAINIDVMDEDGESEALVPAYLRTVNGNTVLAGAGGVNRQLAQGPRTVLFGDSMTDFWEEGLPITAASFDSATGVMTCTLANHFIWTGKPVRVWSYTYPSIRVAQEVELTRISASQFSFPLIAATDVPASPDHTKIFIQGRSINQYVSWVGLYQMRNKQRLNIVKNLAQNGETSKGLAARLAYLQAEEPQLVLMQATGINDENPGVDGTLSEWETNQYNAQAVDGILATGAKLLLLTITPVYTGEARATKASMARVIRKNKFLRDYCAGKTNVAVVDAWREIIDPTNTTGLALVGMTRNDNIHYSHKGALKVCKKAENILNTWFPEVATSLPCSPMDSGDGGKLTVSSATSAADVVTINSTAHGWRVGDEFFVKKMTESAANGVFTVKTVPNANSFTYDAPGTGTATLTAGSVVVTRSPQAFGNPLLLTATGGNVANGVTGVAASKMQASNQVGNTGTLTAVASVAAAPSGIGNEQIITVTAAATNDRPSINTYGTTSFMNDLLLNRKYRFEAMLRVDSTAWANTPISEIYSNIYITWSTGEAYSISTSSGWDGVEAPTLNENLLWHLRSGEIALTPPQAGATLASATWTNYIQFSSALSGGATLVMGLSQISITDVGSV